MKFLGKLINAESKQVQISKCHEFLLIFIFFFIETPVFSPVQIGYSVQNNSEFFLLKAEASFSKKSERTGIKLGSSGRV